MNMSRVGRSSKIRVHMIQEHLIATVQSNQILRTWIKADKRVEERLSLQVGHAYYITNRLVLSHLYKHQHLRTKAKQLKKKSQDLKS